MKKFNKADISVYGRRVMVKQHDGKGGFKWAKMAEFFSRRGVCSEPATQAENFALMITRED